MRYCLRWDTPWKLLAALVRLWQNHVVLVDTTLVLSTYQNQIGLRCQTELQFNNVGKELQNFPTKGQLPPKVYVLGQFWCLLVRGLHYIIHSYHDYNRALLVVDIQYKNRRHINHRKLSDVHIYHGRETWLLA